MGRVAIHGTGTDGEIAVGPVGVYPKQNNALETTHTKK
jgi:hypothetical protein